MNAIPDHPLRIGLGDIAEVISCEGDHILVQSGARRLPARRAASCLIEPAPGDLVLVGGTVMRCYILAVLEQQAEGTTRIAVPGDLELVAPQGRVRVAARQGIDLTTPEEIGISGTAVTVKADRGRLLLDDLVVIGRTALAHLGRARAIGQAFETVVDRILTRSKRSVRVTTESDYLRAGEVDIRATGTLHAHGETNILTASTLVKVDGGQIHLG
jgi:hypothetical protein